jgi:hypothetical protein
VIPTRTKKRGTSPDVVSSAGSRTQTRWHRIAAPKFVPLARAGTTFLDDKLQIGEDDRDHRDRGRRCLTSGRRVHHIDNCPVKTGDVERLSPLRHDHINLRGRSRPAIWTGPIFAECPDVQT